ncbi:hypothetical protein BY996DRAFT_4569373, partial [Phakopsora pachyrhizi]
LHLLVKTVFNNIPLSSDLVSQPRGSIPPNTVLHSQKINGVAGDIFKQNRLITICSGLEGFSLASQGKRVSLVMSIKDCAESL